MTNDMPEHIQRILTSSLLQFIDAGEGVDSTFVDVSPEVARYIMKYRNPHNRSLRTRDVEDMKRDMRRGKWPLNGETAKFDYDGNCLDGQHRLTALGSLDPVDLKDGVLKLLIVSGLEPEAQESIDKGIKRTHGDALRLRGITDPNNVAATVRKAIAWERGDYRFSSNVKPTFSEVSEFLDAHPEVLRSTQIGSRVRAAFPYVPTSVVGVTHYVCSKIDEETAVWFFQRLEDGADISKGHPVLTLRKRLMKEKGLTMAVKDGDDGKKLVRHSVSPWVYVTYIIAAWNAVRRGDDLSLITINPNKVLLPE